MGSLFSPNEILNIAIGVEENGRNFYASLEEKSKDYELKKTWIYLKTQEEAHRKIFQEMLKQQGDYFISEFNPGEYYAYLSAISSEYVFTQELIRKKTKENFVSNLEVIDFAIRIEKDSILVYSALKEYALDKKQSVLNKVIDEEREHLIKLISLKDSIIKDIL